MTISAKFKCILIIVLTSSFLFLGCKRQSETANYSFLVLARPLENEFHSSLVAGAKTAALEQKVDLQIRALNSEDDYQLQEKILRGAVGSRNIDGVIITPGHSTKLIPVLRELDAIGIPFTIVDTPLELSDELPFKHYCGFVGTDNQLGGALAAEYIGKATIGNVLLMRGVVSHRTSQDRESGFLGAMKRYPSINVVNIIDGRWDYIEAKKVLKKLSKSELASIDAVFAYNDLMALAVADFFHENGLRPIIVGYDGILEAQSAIISGKIDASVAQAPGAMGRRAIAKLRHCIERQHYPSDVDLTYVTLLVATRTITAVSNYEK